MAPPTEDYTSGTDPPSAVGRIDIHCHLLPAVDDGCENFEQTWSCITALQRAGYTGSICTPHVYPQDPKMGYEMDFIQAQTAQLQQRLRNAGSSYRLWPGGELRLYDGVIDWLKHHRVPTLAGSRCVLVDFWSHKWPKWVNAAFEWMLEQGYRPILAHPERLACTKILDQRLAEIAQMGVWLQGNFRCISGEEGFEASQWVRRLLGEDRYQFLALDAHKPDSLGNRLDGLQLVAAEFGEPMIDQLTSEAPRKLILANAV